MILIRAEHVEEFEAHPLRRKLRAAREAIDNGEVEQMFAEAVQIHGPEPLQGRKRPVVIEARGAVAVSCSRGGIDEGSARRRAPIQKLE